MAKTRGKEIKVFLPFTKVEALEDGTCIVEGIATAEVLDADGEIVDFEASKAAFSEWSDYFQKATDGESFGNIRSMHGNIAAGKAVAWWPDEEHKAIMLRSHIIDPTEAKKCIEKVYLGYSIGGKVPKKDGYVGNHIVKYKLSETSLVDKPACPVALFSLVKLEVEDELDEDDKEAGDVPGHEFHGNQYAGVGGSAAREAQANSHRAQADSHRTTALEHEDHARAAKESGDVESSRLHQAAANAHHDAAWSHRQAAEAHDVSSPHMNFRAESAHNASSRAAASSHRAYTRGVADTTLNQESARASMSSRHAQRTEEPDMTKGAKPEEEKPGDHKEPDGDEKPGAKPDGDGDTHGGDAPAEKPEGEEKPAPEGGDEKKPEGEEKPADEENDPVAKVSKRVDALEKNHSELVASHGQLCQTVQKMLDTAAGTNDESEKVVKSAVESGVGPLLKRLKELEDRLKVCEDRPAERALPGSPVEKALGFSKSGNTEEQDPAELAKYVTVLERAGLLTGQAQIEARKALAASLMPTR